MYTGVVGPHANSKSQDAYSLVEFSVLCAAAFPNAGVHNICAILC